MINKHKQKPRIANVTVAYVKSSGSQPLNLRGPPKTIKKHFATSHRPFEIQSFY